MCCSCEKGKTTNGAQRTITDHFHYKQICYTQNTLAYKTHDRSPYACTVYPYTAKEWDALVAGNPFTREARTDPGHLLLLCLKDAPGKGHVTALQAAIVGREKVQADGRHLYIIFPDGVGRSRLTTALIERTLRTRGTGRNWNTVLKLRALTSGG